MTTSSLFRLYVRRDTPVFSFCLLVISTLALLIAGCGGVNPGPGTPGTPAESVDLTHGGIRGTILGEDGIPIPEALIETTSRQAISGMDGRYLLTGLPAGDYRVTARASAWQPQVRDQVRVFTGQVTESVNFTLASSPAEATSDLRVIAISPAFGTDGDSITVLGIGFGRVQGRVTVAGQEAGILDWNGRNDGSIVIRLPAEVETGPVKVYAGGRESTEVQAVTFVGRPVAVSVTPTSAKAGATVTLAGRNFHWNASFNKVRLNGVDCQVVGDPTPTRELRVVLPANAQTGLLTVRIESNEYQLDGISSALITIQPQLVHLTPRRSLPGIDIVLYGRNFGTDRSVVRVKLGDGLGGRTIQPADFVSFSSTRLVFKAPATDLVAAGSSVAVTVMVNEAPSEALTWSSYNPALTTLDTYGIYRFEDVSQNQTLQLPTLGPNDRIAFLTTLTGNGQVDLGGEFSYSVSAYMGDQTEQIPALPSAAGRNALVSRRPSPSNATMFRETRAGRRTGLAVRGAISDPAPATLTFWLRDITATNPDDPTADREASGTLIATGTRCLVYRDEAPGTTLTASDAERLAALFDGMYDTIATACWDGITAAPPEGNIDSQARILLFATPKLQEGAAATADRLAVYDPRDRRPTDTHSLGTELITVWDRAVTTREDDLKGALAEQYHAMLFENQKGPSGPAWIQAGLGQYGRQACGQGYRQGNARAVTRVAGFLRQPHTVSLNHWPVTPAPDDPAYGMTYLFTQYLFERCGGESAIRTLARNTGSVGFVDIENNILLSGATNPATPNLETFLNDFFLALYCDNLGLPDTFNGYDKSRWGFSTLDLRTQYADVLGLRHLTFNEDPVNSRQLDIKGYGADVFEYKGGNGGDLRVNIGTPGSPGTFRTWVLYYPAR
jgi:hypothetical protein